MEEWGCLVDAVWTHDRQMQHPYRRWWAGLEIDLLTYKRRNKQERRGQTMDVWNCH